LRGGKRRGKEGKEEYLDGKKREWGEEKKGLGGNANIGKDMGRRLSVPELSNSLIGIEKLWRSQISIGELFGWMGGVYNFGIILRERGCSEKVGSLSGWTMRMRWVDQMGMEWCL
jgi:hypothetical protein